MNYFTTLLQGTIASLIAVILWEFFRQTRKYYNNYRLKTALGIKNKKCFIITNLRHRDTKEELIHYKISYSLGHIIEIVNKLRVDSQVIPYHKLSEFDDVSDIISVGGPLSNDYTKKILSDYKIDWSTTKQDEINKYTEPIKHNIITGFKINKTNYPAEDYREPAVILKLTKKETKHDRNILLIFGLNPQGTAAAAYFITQEYKRLYKKFKNGMFYIVIYCSSRESYKLYEDDYIDLTKKAFKK